jgi:hypothetical protein
MSDPAPPPEPVSTGQILREADETLNISLPQWEGAMRACFHFEVIVRILAQKHFLGESITRDVADGKKGEGLLTLLFRLLTFTEEEKLYLLRCNSLRNKLIHCEPDGVLRVLREIMPDFAPPNRAFRINLSGGESGAELVTTIQTMRGAVPVQRTSSREDGFLGWMLESAANGTFLFAVEVFVGAVRIVDSKADQEPSAGAVASALARAPKLHPTGADPRSGRDRRPRRRGPRPERS